LKQYFRGEVPSFLDIGPDPKDYDLQVTFFGQTTPPALARELRLPSKPDAAELKAELGLPLSSDYMGVVRSYIDAMDRYDFSNALANVWYGVHKVNTYLVVRQPWTLERSAPLLSRTLYRAADLLRTIAVLVYPFLPDGAERIWKQLGCRGRVEDQRFSELRWGGLQTGTQVAEPEPTFPRLDKEPTMRKLAEMAEADRTQTTTMKKEARKTVEASAEQKISIEEFAKVDMRVGEVLAAEPVPGAQKLTKLQVDIGSEVRQVVAGIAEYYKPEQLIGMKVVIVTNLEPRKLRGVESNGMVVAATVGEEGRPVLCTFTEEVPKGARLK